MHPTRLYKYFPAERLAVLTNGLVRFTQPGDFNDPFEMRAPIARVMSSDEMHAQLRDETKKKVVEQLQRSREYRRLSPVNSDALVEKFLDIAVNSAKSETVPLLDSAHNAFCNVMSNQLMPDAANKVLGVLCLSEIGTNPLMWGHYTNSYVGFALEFDATHEFFTCPSGMHEDVGQTSKVRYTNERPTLSFGGEPSLAFMFSKASDWSYENEWRMIRTLKNADSVIPQSPFDIHLFRVPFEAITSVIVGHRMTKSNFDSLCASLAAAPLRHVSLQRIQLHETEFSLTIEPVKSWPELNADATRAAVGRSTILNHVAHAPNWLNA